MEGYKTNTYFFTLAQKNMCAKTRKLKSGRRNDPKGSLFTILIVFVIISILAAAVAYFFYDVGKTRHKTEPVTPTKKPKTEVTKPVVPAENELNGTWVSSNDGRILEIHGNRFTLELPSVSDHEITHGTLAIKGRQVTLFYTGTKDQCLRQPGVYSFQLSKGKLRFIPKQDVCAGRKKIFSALWEKF